LKSDNKMKNVKMLVVYLICTVIACIAMGILPGIFLIIILLFYRLTVVTVIGFIIHLILSVKTITKKEVLIAILCIVLIYFSFKYSNQILTIIRGIISKYA